LQNLAVTVAKVSRSQIASFVGNLVIVLPLSFCLAWLYHWIFKVKIADGKVAVDLLRDQHPWSSPSLFYACITGFFLFLSGIIAGYIQNKIQYSRIAERLQMHPALRISFPQERLHKMSLFLEKNAGTIIGNVALGFFLGMAATLGNLFGLPFDVRHITISAANTGIGVYGIGIQNIPPLYLLTVIMGIFGIGFLNFLVSFSLAFAVAVKSRGVRLKDYPEFLYILWRYFIKNPMAFIRPPKKITEGELAGSM
jgi:site-specific recombinase